MQRELKQIFIVTVVADHSAYVEAFETERGALSYLEREAVRQGYAPVSFPSRLVLALWINGDGQEFTGVVHEKFINR